MHAAYKLKIMLLHGIISAGVESFSVLLQTFNTVLYRTVVHLFFHGLLRIIAGSKSIALFVRHVMYVKTHPVVSAKVRILREVELRCYRGLDRATATKQ